MSIVPRLALLSAIFICAAAAYAEPPAFADQVPPPPPDYARSAAWAAGLHGPGASTAVPIGATLAARRPVADVFFVHPTTFRSDSRWNQDIADTATNEWTDASSIARQASIFNGCCRIFAPRYRQASFLDRDGGRTKALDLAYGDIERAFDRYLRVENRGRPFILAGHSQGAWLIAKLLERRIDGTPLARRMVAAYVIGVNVAEGDFGRRYRQLQPCDTPLQTGCVVQWNAVLPDADLPAIARRSEQAFVDRYGDVPGRTTLCVNPLTFDRGRPSAAASKGALPGEPGAGPLRPLVPGKVAARCEQGLLVVTADPTLDLAPLPGGSLHYHDLGLFYADVRANAVARVRAWIRAHPRRKG